MDKPRKVDIFPGFTALNDRVYFRDPEPLSSDDKAARRSPDHPRVVILFGWGDSLPKHLTKFTTRFRTLYPGAKQVVILAPIAHIMRQDVQTQTAKIMLPVIEAAFPKDVEGRDDEDSVLVHTMSNLGCISYSAALHAYRTLHGGRPMPHRLTVFDSTPGSTSLNLDSLQRWSRGMAYGTANWFPWPFMVTQCIWGVFLCANRLFEVLLRKDSAPMTGLRLIFDKDYEMTSARKLLMYSKEDDLVLWSDIEANMLEMERRGSKVDSVLFEGSGHVSHMRDNPEKYWGAISAAWKVA